MIKKYYVSSSTHKPATEFDAPEEALKFALDLLQTDDATIVEIKKEPLMDRSSKDYHKKVAHEYGRPMKVAGDWNGIYWTGKWRSCM